MDDLDLVGDDPEFPSGEWTGFYAERGAQRRQGMHLTFCGGRVSGAGGDAIGDFVIRGRYDRESREVTWTKTYPGSHNVHYRGFREIHGIWGTWEIPPVASGGFHVWPRADSNAEAAITAADLDVPAAAPVVTAAPN